MKKLKLYGEKKILGLFKKKGFIAEIYVTEGKIAIESKNKKVRIKLLKDIGEMVDENQIVLEKHVMEKYSNGRPKKHIQTYEIKKPGDLDFLNAVKDYSAYWNVSTFGGYKISGLLSQLTDK